MHAIKRPQSIKTRVTYGPEHSHKKQQQQQQTTEEKNGNNGIPQYFQRNISYSKCFMLICARAKCAVSRMRDARTAKVTSTKKLGGKQPSGG